MGATLGVGDKLGVLDCEMVGVTEMVVLGVGELELEYEVVMELEGVGVPVAVNVLVEVGVADNV